MIQSDRGCDYCGDTKPEPIKAWPSPQGYGTHWPHIYLHAGACWRTFAADQQAIKKTGRTRAEYLSTVTKL